MGILTFCVLVCLVAINPNCAHAARILGVFPTPSKSHWFLGSALMKELALDGHDVTDVSPFHLTNPPENYHHVEVQTDHEFFGRKYKTVPCSKILLIKFEYYRCNGEILQGS